MAAPALPVRLASLAQAGPLFSAAVAGGAEPLTILDVPFISQSEALCGGAAAAMVLRYWGERGLAAESFAHLVDRSAAGIRTTALIGELRRRGWDASAIVGTVQILSAELTGGRPVVTLIEDRPGTFHYIVIVAATARAIVFHDPARAPMRVIGMDEFERRWRAADRWMAIVLPGKRVVADDVTPARPDVDATAPCDRLVAEGIERSQAGDFDGAEQRLTAALTCPGAAALRELAGLRLLQRRWADVQSLSSAAIDIDSSDAHAWRLLATSRFVQNDRLAALDAWNRVAEPRIDLISVAGLERTRQRIVERQIGAAAGELLTAQSFARARRRLEALPAASGARLDYVPVPSGLVELRASVSERRTRPGLWDVAALGLVAVARREVEYSLSSPSGGGERLTAGWRFWPERPKYSLSFAAPAPWGGLWTAAFSSERQPFDREGLPRAERTRADLRLSNWMTSIAHVEIHGGIEDWSGAGTAASVGTTVRLSSLDDRVDVRMSADAWSATASFTKVEGGLTARSSAERQGAVYIGRLHAGTITDAMPPEAWLAGDIGVTRGTLLRAHPLVADGRLRTAQLGRRIVAGGAEAQYWWAAPFTRLGGALFLDAARVGARLSPGARGDVDAGAGLRVALPAVAGTFRADLAKGLRDGATTFSFVYEP
jgi:hypothetical protein